jgi:two-component system, NtrC family, sensor kinase
MWKRLASWRACLCAASLHLFFCADTSAQDQHEADSLIQVLETTTVPDSAKFEILRRIAFQSTRPVEMLEYAEQLITLATKHSSYVWLHRGHLQKGNALKFQGDFDLAIAEYFKSVEMALKGNYQTGVGGAFLSIAGVYGDMGDHVKGIKYKRKAIGILRDSGDSLTLAASLLNTGYEYYRIANYDSALFFFDESGQIYERKNFLVGKAYNLGNSGLVYARTGDAEKAEQFLSEAIQILIGLSDSYAITEFQTEMADIYLQKKDFKSAEKLLHEALRYAEADGLQERVRDASLSLSELYLQRTDFEKAYTYLHQYITYRDSIKNEDVIQEMADLRTEFEVGQKQIEVDLLHAQARTQRIVLIAVGTVLVLVVILVYVLFRLYKLRNRAIKISRERRKIIASQRDRLEELNNTKDKFFSIISHDIRGPVGNFHGFVRLIELSLESGDTSDLVEISQMLDKSAIELSSLLDNLLHWAMSQQGKFPNKPERLDLVRLCNENMGMVENIAAAKQITLTKSLPAAAAVFADKNSVSTITRNLLSNALKFTKKGGVVGLSLNCEGNECIITVSDSGIGIPAEKMNTLFGFDAGRSQWGTGGEKGVGLGLNLVKEFVDMNKGRIEVESEEGVGTTFRVYLPVAGSSVN